MRGSTDEMRTNGNGTEGKKVLPGMRRSVNEKMYLYGRLKENMDEKIRKL